MKSKSALAGVKVADFSWVIAGPLITKCLADFGAQVIKIESRTHPDLSRLSAPFIDGKVDPDYGPHFAVFNTSKYSLRLNLGRPEAADIVTRLIKWADVVVENFSGRVLKRLGLEYDRVKSINPSVILLSMSAWGKTGLLGGMPGYGGQVQAVAGVYNYIGWPDEPPTLLPVAHADNVAPLFGAIALLSALARRRQTGEGEHIDICQLETAAACYSHVYLEGVAGQERTRRGNRSLYHAPHGIFRCKGNDRWCTIVIFNDDQMKTLFKIMDSPPWAADARFDTISGRKENEDELERLIEAWTINHSAEEVMHQLQEVGIAAGIVANAEDLMEHDPQLKHRHYFETIEHPTYGQYKFHNWPASLSKTPAQLRRSPLLGEHTEYICTELLGMSTDEFVELFNQDVFD